MSEEKTIALAAAGVSLWLELVGSDLPTVVYWGAQMPDSADDVAAAVLASAPVHEPNAPDVPARVGILPESRTGYLGRPGVAGHRFGRAWSPWWRVTSVEVDGVPIDAHHGGGAGAVLVRAEDPDTRLALALEIELTPQGLVRTRATVTNTDDEPWTVEQVAPVLPIPQRATELADFAGRWGSERLPQRRPITVGLHVRENRRGRTGHDSAYVMSAGTPGFTFRHGEVWSVHTAWSGNHIHVAELTASGERSLGGGELLLPGEVVLSRDESYTSPWLYGSYGEGLDGVAGRFHAYLRARPNHPGPDRPVTVNCWEAVYLTQNVDRLLELIDAAAAIGAERFVLDDGWFGARRDDLRGLGDWQVSADVYPDGLHPLVDRVLGHGMQFGIWFEPEMVNLDSDVARAHPDWVMQVPGRIPVPSRHQHVLNLTIPEAYDYIRDAMVAILNEYDISYIKWDHNRDLVDPGTVPMGGVPAVHAQTLATYRLMAELKEAKPGLEIESCASGGGRIDLGVMEICDRVWASDCNDPEERLRINQNTLQLLPPEMIGAHIASPRSHQTFRQHDLPIRLAAALFGHLGIEWDVTRITDEERAQLAEAVELYKTLRPLLLSGTVVRGDLPDPEAYLTGVVSPEGDRALYRFVATSTPVAASWGRWVLPGLKEDARYEVRPLTPGLNAASVKSFVPAWFGEGNRQSFAGATFSGAHLTREGVPSPVARPEVPVLLLVREV